MDAMGDGGGDGGGGSVVVVEGGEAEEGAPQSTYTHTKTQNDNNNKKQTNKTTKKRVSRDQLTHVYKSYFTAYTHTLSRKKTKRKACLALENLQPFSQILLCSVLVFFEIEAFFVGVSLPPPPHLL